MLPYMHMYVHVIYKSKQIGVQNKFTTQIWCQSKYAIDKFWAQRQEIYEWQTSCDQGQGL